MQSGLPTVGLVTSLILLLGIFKNIKKIRQKAWFADIILLNLTYILSLFQLNRRKRTQPENRQELNGYIANSTVYVTSINENGAIESKPTISSPKAQPKSLQAKPAPVIANGIDKKKDIIKEEDKVEPEKHEVDASEKVKVVCESDSGVVVDRDISDAYSVAREHLNNGRSEKLIGEQPDHRIRATAIVENNKLGPGENR